MPGTTMAAALHKPPADIREAGRLATARAALIFVLALTTINALFNVVARGLGLGFPYTTFLFRPDDDFADFFSLLASYPGGGAARAIDHAGIHALLPPNPLWARPLENGGPPVVTNLHMTPLSTAAALGAVRLLPLLDPVLLFLALLALLGAGWWTIARRVATSRAEATIWFMLGLVAYPTLMMVVRGNLFAGATALMVAAALLMGVARRRPGTAAILLAYAVNIRPNAILFALPLLAFYAGAARWRFGVTLTIAGLALFGAGLAIASAFYPGYGLGAFLAALKTYYRYYAIGYWGLAYGSSLFGALKLLGGGYRAGIDGAAMLVALAIAGTGLALFARRRIDEARLLFLICAAYCLGSTVIGDYHLAVFVVVPMALARQEGWATNAAGRATFVATCLILAPKNYAFWGKASLQIVLNPLILLGAAGAVIGTALVRSASPARREPSSPALTRSRAA